MLRTLLYPAQYYVLLLQALRKGSCAGMAWGNGFTIDQTLIRQYNLSDPSGFFEDISAVPTLANRTILSPHVYGPNITVRAHSSQGRSTKCMWLMLQADRQSDVNMRCLSSTPEHW